MVDNSSLASKYDAYIDRSILAVNWENPLTAGFVRVRGESRSDAGILQINVSPDDDENTQRTYDLDSLSHRSKIVWAHVAL